MILQTAINVHDGKFPINIKFAGWNTCAGRKIYLLVVLDIIKLQGGKFIVFLKDP